MANTVNPFGLSASVISDLHHCFSQYPSIEKVLIFGSRAKGNYRDGADIDLAVMAPAMANTEFTCLWNALDALPLVFKLDTLHWNRLENERLKHKILAEGKCFYPPAQG